MRGTVAKRLRRQSRVEGRPDRSYVIVRVDGRRKESTVSGTGCYLEPAGNRFRTPMMVSLTQCDRQDYQKLKNQWRAS